MPSGKIRNNIMVMCDFDGTITEHDTGEFILKRFACGEWMPFEKQLLCHEITLEECIKRQFLLVQVPQSVILEEVERMASFRQGFGDLVSYCKTNKLRFIVVSAGLSFCIRRLLECGGWLESVEIIAPIAKCTSTGIRLTFPRIDDSRSENFKEDSVKTFKRLGKKVIYIGDGPADFQAAKIADFPFAIKGSKLAKLCESEGIPYQELSDFTDVITKLKQNS